MAHTRITKSVLICLQLWMFTFGMVNLNTTRESWLVWKTNKNVMLYIFNKKAMVVGYCIFPEINSGVIILMYKRQ